MIIPHYWAECRLQKKLPERQVTVKRWGWSDVSQAEAQTLAEQRAQEAMARILSGEDLRRLEAKNAYGTEDGAPIREEVVSRQENVVITRNSYGSLCLNTPNVLFADVDNQWREVPRASALGLVAALLAAIAGGLSTQSLVVGVGTMVAGLWLWMSMSDRLDQKRRVKEEANLREANLVTIRAFAAKHPDWHLRVYETPALERPRNPAHCLRRPMEALRLLVRA